MKGALPTRQCRRCLALLHTASYIFMATLFLCALVGIQFFFTATLIHQEMNEPGSKAANLWLLLAVFILNFELRPILGRIPKKIDLSSHGAHAISWSTYFRHATLKLSCLNAKADLTDISFFYAN